MGLEKNKKEAQRWYRTGLDDFETAELLLKHQRYAHCCFNAQQSAEKAVKALFYQNDKNPWGNSLVKLLTEGEKLSIQGFGDIAGMRSKAALLDRFYIPTRYPNGLPDLIPSEAYTKEDAESAVTIAKEFIERAQHLLSF